MMDFIKRNWVYFLTLCICLGFIHVWGISLGGIIAINYFLAIYNLNGIKILSRSHMYMQERTIDIMHDICGLKSKIKSLKSKIDS